jgi:hypothetical protein
MLPGLAAEQKCFQQRQPSDHRRENEPKGKHRIHQQVYLYLGVPGNKIE